MLKLYSTYHLYPPATATRIAAELTAADTEGWRYEAKHDPTGRGQSFIEIFDDAGEYVARF
jgi:hypothetical protein